MDILGSIMKNMVKPPAIDEKERRIRQLQKESLKKEQEENERIVREFRLKVTKQIENLTSDEAQLKLQFEPMDKLFRAIIHDIAETAGLLAHSFGTDEVDRHVIVFKPEGIPSEPEMAALKRGEEYDPQLDTQEDNYIDYDDVDEETNRPKVRGRRKREDGPAPEYLHKYEKHLGGLEVAKEAAESTRTSNRNYGFVNSEQKRDRRTIEETLADIRARKRQKFEENEKS